MLIDPGSEASFVTENCVRILGLRRTKCDTQITGLSASAVGSARGLVKLQISSRHQDYQLTVNALILSKVTGLLPKHSCSQQQWSHLEGLQLADPRFYEPGHVDILLGADYSSSVMRGTILEGTSSTPYAHESVFGWLISGIAASTYPASVRVHHADCGASGSGVDYAGPFSMRVMKGRTAKTFKAYLAIFVCMTTKAMHLEVVSDMSTDAFIAALRRFTSRRGLSNDMYNDCGTNFVGADAELKQLLISTSHNAAVADHSINWHFNPPSAPHQGGLWEAGVKSVKFHLRRVVGNATLTFEEFQTVLCQIEACLNSRPLNAMSNDPADFTVLTPGHFLIGSALTAVPEPDLTKERINRLTRWQFIQQLVQHFWRRWSVEYLSSLQQRFKWKAKRDNLEVGDLVLIKDDALSPTKWKLGRIVRVHPGADNQVRVATVKTATSEYQRQIVKLCPILRVSE